MRGGENAVLRAATMGRGRGGVRERLRSWAGTHGSHVSTALTLPHCAPVPKFAALALDSS